MHAHVHPEKVLVCASVCVSLSSWRRARAVTAPVCDLRVSVCFLRVCVCALRVPVYGLACLDSASAQGLEYMVAHALLPVVGDRRQSEDARACVWRTAELKAHVPDMPIVRLLSPPLLTPHSRRRPQGTEQRPLPAGMSSRLLWQASTGCYRYACHASLPLSFRHCHFPPPRTHPTLPHARAACVLVLFTIPHPPFTPPLGLPGLCRSRRSRRRARWPTSCKPSAAPSRWA